MRPYRNFRQVIKNLSQKQAMDRIYKIDKINLGKIM